MDTCLLLDPVMVQATNKHYTFNLPYEDTSSKGALYLVPGVSA